MLERLYKINYKKYLKIILYLYFIEYAGMRDAIKKSIGYFVYKYSFLENIYKLIHFKSISDFYNEVKRILQHMFNNGKVESYVAYVK